jgi:hypothetical protein
MGQYGNQPDFGTIVTTLDKAELGKPFPPSAIYVGETEDSQACALDVLPVGNDPADVITITGVLPGTFLPIIVVRIDATLRVDKANVLLYR